MSNIKVNILQQEHKYTLTGTEGYGFLGRLSAAILFTVFGLISVNSLLDLYFFDGDYSNLVHRENLADELTGDITLFVVVVSVVLLFLIGNFFDKFLDFVSASLRLSGAVKLLMDVALHHFLPGSFLVLLIIFAWPLSKFIIAPMVAAVAKSPLGLLLHRLLWRFVFFFLTYICFSALTCSYNDLQEYHFERAADKLTVHFRSGFPLFVGLKKELDSNNINFVPLVYFNQCIYEFPLAAIRSVHRYQFIPTLALDVLGHQIYLPTVTHRNQRECDETLASLANWLGVPRGRDLDAVTGREKVQLREDVLQAIRTRVLPSQGDDAALALLVTSALTMAQRHRKRLTTLTCWCWWVWPIWGWASGNGV